MTANSTVLVTGGAGYIGSHTVLQLVARGERVVVLDDLSTGFRQAVRDVPLVVGNVGDRKLVDRLLAEHSVDTIIHFAAHTIVPESVSNPLKYYGNNTCATRSLLEAASQAGVKHFVFSSTAAVYGIPAAGVASEDSPTAPINAVRHLEAHVRMDAARPLRRHADAPRRRCATSTSPAPTRRAASASRRARRRCSSRSPAKRPSANARILSVFGTDYPTPDGTGVRDYIHVDDLATAHLNALDYLRAGGESLMANVGYGHGYSVREVLSSVEKIAGIKLDVREEPRRAGDPPSLVAKCDKVRQLLKWQPRLDDIDTIVRTSLEWEKRLQREPW